MTLTATSRPRRTLILTVLVTAAAAAAAAGPLGAAEDLVLVKDGAPLAVRFDGNPWSTHESALVAKGEGRNLWAAPLLRDDAFTVRARLRITDLSGSAASFRVGQSHFGFEGTAGKMFIEGPELCGGTLGPRFLGAPAVQEGRPFNLLVTLKDGKLSVSIDSVVHLVAPWPRAGGKGAIPVGFRPHRATVHLESFTASGTPVAPPQPIAGTTVFERGVGGYHTYRIPAVVATPEGNLLAFCEGRKEGRGDAGNIDLILRRSADGGKTWTPTQVIWDDGANTCGNPCPVVDRDTGKIWLLLTWNLGTDHERDIMAGKSKHPRHVYVTHSGDEGVTWADPVRISSSARRDHWRWYATGPGNAIQLEHPKSARHGRLVVPANHSDHSDPSQHPYRSHIIYSDDAGATWQIGGVHEEKTNESAVAELADGSVLQAMRSYHGKNRRALATSRDGGHSFGPVTLHEQLDTPVCQASLIRYSWPWDDSRGGVSRLLFSSPRGGARSHMTVWMSTDEGRTWPVQKLVYAGGAAYSNLLALPGGEVGLLYEKDGYRTITWTTFTIDWLTGDGAAE